MPLVGTGLAMLFLLRTLGLGWPAAHVGALSWGFGGLALSLTNLLPMLLAVAPAPALAAFALRIVRGGDRTSIAGVALCTVLVCAGGEPTTIVIAAVLTAISCLIEFDAGANLAVRSPCSVRAAFRPIARLAGATLLGAAAAAVVIVPGIRLAARSARGAGLSPSQAMSWSFPPARFAELVLPHAMGRVDPDDQNRYWGSHLYPTHTFPLIYSIYPGLLITALAFAGLFRPGRQRLGWGLLAVLGSLMAVGRHTLLWPGVRTLVPGFGSLRFPEKWVIVPVFAIVVLAAEELDAALTPDTREERRLADVVAGLGAFNAVTAAAVVALPGIFGASVWHALGLTSGEALYLSRIVPGECIVQLALAVGVLLAVKTIARDRGRAALLLSALLALDLLVAGRPLVPTRDPKQALDTTVARSVVRSCGSARLFNLADWQQGDKHVITFPTLAIPSGWGVATAYEIDRDLTQPTWSMRATRLFWDAVHSDPTLMSSLLARRGVGLVLQQSEADGPHVMEVTPVSRPRPEVACADRVVRFTGDTGWLTAVRSLGPALRGATLVETSDWGRVPEHVYPCAVAGARVRPGDISAAAVGAGPGSSVVLINQTWDPGWRLTVDGRRAVLHRVDLDLGAVAVPPGRHRIELVYRDDWLKGSLVVSCAALLLCGALVSSALRRRVTRRPEARDRGGR